MMDVDRVYEYRPLATPSTLRLIKIMPEQVDDCIACKLYTVDVQQHPDIKYEALSYVWGNPKHTQRIYLAREDEEEWSLHPLHENLWRVLRHAWELKMFDRLFWTDCLCLNQGDRDEIAQQIPRMGSIYSNAEQVLSWLHLGEYDYRCLLEIMELFDSDHQAAPVNFQRLQVAAHSIASDVYWRRAWIVQEVALAKRVLVISGNVVVDFDVLWSRLAELLREFDADHRTLFGRDLTQSHCSMRVHCDLREAGGKMPLWKLFFEFGGYETTRPADQVYGLLGMVADNEDGSSPVEDIQIDYERDIVAIHLDVLYKSSPPWTELIKLANKWYVREPDFLHSRPTYGKQVSPDPVKTCLGGG
ncbi:hypothetical protein SLS53_002571 [Cytospora paraplurivora]|uniref:Heterokaryon incompatibility domain-containing protein n=1 Tax=Cytospora paraplurivora TaxID=2898453 RepID=A0AAN9UM29_9PEZI